MTNRSNQNDDIGRSAALSLRMTSHDSRRGIKCLVALMAVATLGVTATAKDASAGEAPLIPDGENQGSRTKFLRTLRDQSSLLMEERLTDLNEDDNAKENGDKYTYNPRQRELPSSPASDHDEEQNIDSNGKKRFIVKYNNPNAILDVQMIGSIHQQLEDDHILSIEADEQGAELLRLDTNIDLVEENSVWGDLGYLEEMVPLTTKTPSQHLRRQRHLQDEVVPYGIPMIQADQLPVGPHPCTVCVVDSGVTADHADLSEAQLNGASRVSDYDGSFLAWNRDKRRHGTHVTGLLAATMDNGIGIRGVGNLSVFVTRALNQRGKAFQSDIMQAIEQCKQDPNTRIINLSLGGESITNTMSDLFADLYDEGFLLLAATGNKASNEKYFPAAHPDVISVSAVTTDGTPWNKTSHGNWNELAAAGDTILSTVPRSICQKRTTSTGRGKDKNKDKNDEAMCDYATMSGTSMSTPFVAGAAALVWSHFPSCTNRQIRYALAYTASKDPLGDATASTGAMGCDDYYGYGVVQAKAAFDFLSDHPCSSANWGQGRSSGYCGSIDVEPESPIGSSIVVEDEIAGGEEEAVPGETINAAESGSDQEETEYYDVKVPLPDEFTHNQASDTTESGSHSADTTALDWTDEHAVAGTTTETETNSSGEEKTVDILVRI